MREVYADESDDSINKRANIEEFINSVDEYCRLNEGADLTDYLNQVTLSSDTDEMDDSNYVTLATIHSVKGLEFKCVFIVGLEENVMPVTRAANSEEDLEEERRLMYVAVTRARERLYLTRSKSRYLYGKREPTARSRFLKELSAELSLPGKPPCFPRLRRRRLVCRRRPRGVRECRIRRGQVCAERRKPIRRGHAAETVTEGTEIMAATAFGVRKLRAAAGGKLSGGRVEGERGGGVHLRRRFLAEAENGGKGPFGFPHGNDGGASEIRQGERSSRCAGAGANTILDIAFAGLGIKQLSAALAPLTVGLETVIHRSECIVALAFLAAHLRLSKLAAQNPRASRLGRD